jgi:dTMP kinase
MISFREIMRLKKGVLIVLEGIDGSGKSTQAKFLLESLRTGGFASVCFREPSKSKWGREIKRKALLRDSLSAEQELDLFIKDRRENVRRNLRPALKEKKIVILDRYYYSTIAYQGAKGINRARIRRLNEAFAVRPDLVFILDVGAGEGLRRIRGRKKKDRLFEREEYLVKVRKIFGGLKGKNIVHLRGRDSIETIHKKIMLRVARYLKNRVSC